MCFSATASFAASAALLPAGVYCARAAIRKNRAFQPLAAVPLIFSFHQFSEGLVWLGLMQDNAGLVRTASIIYGYIAVAFWPFWIPLSMAFVATRPGTRYFLVVLALLGLAWTWLYFPILIDPDRWLSTQVVHHSIHYQYTDLPGFQILPINVWRIGYLCLVGIPFLVLSTGGSARLIGVLSVAASFIISYVFFAYAFASVWCFFAAVLALYLCLVFHRLPVRASESGGGAQGTELDAKSGGGG